MGQTQWRASRRAEELSLRFWISLKLLMSSLVTASRNWKQWVPHHLASGEEVTQTVRAEQISLERFPGMESIKAEIIPPSSRVVEKAGPECPILACALRTDMARSALLHGAALLLHLGYLCWPMSRLPSQLLLDHKIVSAGGCFFRPGTGAYIP